MGKFRSPVYCASPSHSNTRARVCAASVPGFEDTAPRVAPRCFALWDWDSAARSA